MQKYDLIVIGSGPGGEKAAIQAAKLGKTVLVVESRERPGGSCMHAGTIPSKTLRESVRHINAMKGETIFGISVRLDSGLTVNRLMHRRNAATLSLVERLQSNFSRNNVDYLRGVARFDSPHRIIVRKESEEGEPEEEPFEFDYAVIATGSRPFRPDWIDFSHPRVLDSDTILSLSQIPKTLTIIGAGVIGCEYASILAPIGVKVNLVNPRNVLLDFLDLEISNALGFLLRDAGIRIRLGERLAAVKPDDEQVLAILESGKILRSDYLLFANGRSGNSEGLVLEPLGIKVTQRSLIEVNGAFQTFQPHIYAVGDVVGFPSLAATAMDQGRMAVLHAFQKRDPISEFHFLPTGIYTFPEISTVGATEEELTDKRVPYEVGSATYREIARGQITGKTTGRLKLLFHRETLKLLGVHIIGESATELIHIGQTVMAFGGTVEYFIDHVFNYPTLSESYRVAALNGVNRL